MRMTVFLAAAGTLAMLASPVLAGDDSMSSGSMSSGSMMSGDAMSGGAITDNSMMMAKSGEVVAIMPDGHMGTAMMSDDKAMSTANMSSPMSGCMMFITTADGHTMMVDTTSDAAKAECESIAK